MPGDYVVPEGMKITFVFQNNNKKKTFIKLEAKISIEILYFMEILYFENLQNPAPVAVHNYFKCFIIIFNSYIFLISYSSQIT